MDLHLGLKDPIKKSGSIARTLVHQSSKKHNCLLSLRNIPYNIVNSAIEMDYEQCICMYRIYQNQLAKFTSFLWKCLEKSEESWSRHGHEHLHSAIQKKKPCNTEKVQTYEGHETGNRPMTAYLCTCSKIL